MSRAPVRLTPGINPRHAPEPDHSGTALYYLILHFLFSFAFFSIVVYAAFLAFGT